MYEFQGEYTLIKPLFCTQYQRRIRRGTIDQIVCSYPLSILVAGKYIRIGTLQPAPVVEVLQREDPTIGAEEEERILQRRGVAEPTK